MDWKLLWIKVGLTAATLALLAGVIAFACAHPGVFICLFVAALVSTVIFAMWTDILGT